MNTDNSVRKHTISVLVENQHGVLARLVGLVSGRGYNIESLNVASTHDPRVSRVTMVVRGGDKVLDQITSQFRKLVEVMKVENLTGGPFLSRECILIKVGTRRGRRAELLDLVNVCGGHILSVSPHALVIELVGEQTAVADFITLLKPFDIIDISRSGVIAMNNEPG